MGTLSALGRSGALRRNTQNLAQLAVSLRQLRNQEIRDDRNYAISSRRLELAESADVREAEVAKRAAAKFGWERQKKEEQDRLDAVVQPWDKYTARMGPKLKAYADEIANSNGLLEDVAGVPSLSVKNGRILMQILNDRLEITSKGAALHVADLRDRKTQLARQRAELSAEGKVPNEKMLEHLNEQEKVLDQEITGAMNAAKAVDEAHQKRLAEQEAKAKADAALERQKQAGRIELIKREEKAGVGKDNRTAMVKNIEYLVANGWSRKDAEDLITGSKPMSRDTFIGQATLRIMTDPYTPDDEKPEKIQRTIEFFDTNIAGSGFTAGVDITPPSGYEKTGQTYEGRPLYYNPQAPKGKEYWHP
jgi:hypothetical protein